MKTIFRFFLLFPLLLYAQYRADETETDPQVVKKLAEWQELKFGLMMHWGPYSQWGVVESWSICSEDEPWCTRNGRPYNDYVRDYEDLRKTFNPLRFDAGKWAMAAREAGMRYLVFTTKHHDGFCMFDSKETEYKITGAECPFSGDPRANVTRELFLTFRDRGFMIGAYFSKPDWHHPDYWAREWATPDRNVNYDPAKYPARWQRFRDFTYNQIQELMTQYGPLDILWLDGGWVRPRASINDENRSWAGMKPYDQNIDLPRIAAMARRHQPGLIIVDRTVTGKYENYRTPEQQIPERPLPYPWETCMTMGGSWSFNPRDQYKSSRQLIHLLIEIVAKGGNFLLNVGPDPTGEWADDVYSRLRDIGVWMKQNGAAIYGSRPVAPYKIGQIAYIKSEDGTTVHAIYLIQEGQNIPEEIFLPGLAPLSRISVSLLGYPGVLKWRNEKEGLMVTVPAGLKKNPPNRWAWVFCIRK